ncbi:TPA: hypothetical protein ACH3X1_006459 [Trebouxia sp. C0004]
MFYFGILYAVAAYVWEVIKKCLIAVLRAGPIPKHLAFIMDGNRRFARKQGLQTIIGHQQGYLKLLDALQWCLDLGVEAITVYAFSIDNFRRDPREVAALMCLAEEKLLDLLCHKDIINTNQVQVRVIGNLSLLPVRVQQAANQVMAATSHHQQCRLNICMAYTSRQEMAQAVHSVHRQVAEGGIVAVDVTADTIEQELYTHGCPPVDLLIRTSGEHRLSDFMLWQSRYAQLVFSNTLWPDYSFWDLLQALVQYQRNYPDLEKIQQMAKASQARMSEDVMTKSCTVLQDSSSLHGLIDSQALSGCAAANADLEAENGKASSDRMSMASTTDVTDVDTSDSSASSESRPASPVCVSRGSSPPRLVSSTTLRHRGEGDKLDCLKKRQEAAACWHGIEYQQSQAYAANPGDDGDELGTDTHEEPEISEQSDEQGSSQETASAALKMRNGQSVLQSRTLHAGAGCEHALPTCLNRRKPYCAQIDTVD